MFRFVLSLTLAVGLASATTISASATCDGATTVGTTSASCGDGLAGASASVVNSRLLFGVEVQAGITPAGQQGASSFASANFSGDYVFTVLGATGAGFFYPCFIAGSSPHGGAGGQGVFDGISLFFSTGPSQPGNCSRADSALFPLSKPFTFGVPQGVPVGIEASAGISANGSIFQTSGSESLDHILFFDPAGNRVSNATFTLVEVPEPAAWSMLIMGLIFLSGGIRVLSVSLAVGLVPAATISTSATCDGVTTTGTFSASCNDADITGFASASAMVQPGETIGISVRTAVQSLMNPHSASASANISGHYVFTVFGGTGGGFFYPCFVGSFASHSGALGEGSFGGVSFQFTGSSSVPASNCRVFGSLSDFFPLSKPFTFGAYRKSFR